MLSSTQRIRTILSRFVVGNLIQTQVRYWRYNRYKQPWKFIKPVVPLDKLNINEPVSASLVVDEGRRERKFEWDAASMNAKGFLRYQKEYKPPEDVEEQVFEVVKEVLPNKDLEDEKIMEYQLKDERLKFQLLSKLYQRMNHSVPNSMLYMIERVQDVVKFYKTEIKARTPFDELVKSQEGNELPPNLHIMPNPIRFHPETDTLFGGMTAFPKSSTIVTGLRTKKKYKGYEAKKTWP